MRKMIAVVLMALLMVPGFGFAADKKAAKKDKKAAKEAVKPAKAEAKPEVKDAAKKPVKRYRGEVVYLNQELTAASFNKGGEFKLRHDLYYTCNCCDTHRRTPGVCAKCKKSCGQCALVPSFKHGAQWYALSYDQGKIVVGSIEAACGCGKAKAAEPTIPAAAVEDVPCQN